MTNLIPRLKKKPCKICKHETTAYCEHLYRKGRGCVQSCYTCIFGLDNQCGKRYTDDNGKARRVVLVICGNYAPINHLEVKKREKGREKINDKRTSTKRIVRRVGRGVRKTNGGYNK